MNRKSIILIIASMGILVEALDIAIMNLAIPSIQKAFLLGSATAQWLQTLYILLYGGFLIIGGKLTDVYGTKKIFLSGCALFLLTSLAAGLSVSFGYLLFFRAIQGIGAALIMPAAFSIINHTFTGDSERGRAMGIFSSFAALGSASGLSLGGIITSYLGWQWIFFINVPVLLVVIVVALKTLPKDAPRTRQTPDVLSGGLLVAGLAALTFAIQQLADLPNNAWRVMAFVAIAGTCAVWLFRRLREIKEPMVDLSLIRIPSLLTGNTAFMLLGAFFTGYLFLISIILQQNMHFTPVKAGLVLSPYSFLSVVVARFMLPRIISRYKIIGTAILGMACMLTGSIMLAGAVVYSYLPTLLVAAAAISGFGITICFTGFSVLAMQQVPAAHYGVGASLTSTSYFFGGSIGLPLLTLFMSHDALVSSVSVAPVIVLALIASSAIICLIIYSQKAAAGIIATP